MPNQITPHKILGPKFGIWSKFEFQLQIPLSETGQKSQFGQIPCKCGFFFFPILLIKMLSIRVKVKPLFALFRMGKKSKMYIAYIIGISLLECWPTVFLDIYSSLNLLPLFESLYIFKWLTFFQKKTPK